VTLGLLTACQAPGMKMTMRPNRHESPVEVTGLAVTLHPVTPELVVAQAGRTTPRQDLTGLLAEKLKPYRVGPQDVLLATIWDHPEITLPMGPNRTDTSSGNLVEEDGFIFFPYVGKLKVSGLTVSEIRTALTAELAKVLRNPQVDVKVIAYRSQKVYVGGEVRNPAVYAVTDVPFTLAEAVNRAGGFLPTCDDTRMVLMRGNRTWRLNFRELVASGDSFGRLVLQDGDALHVPNATEEPVYMMGELVRPGNVALVHGSLSLARALSEAGGIQVASADATSIYVIRSASAKNVDVFHLDGRNPASMVLADKFALNPRDIVFVDAGSLVRFQRVMNLVLPTLTAVTATTVGGVEAYYFKKRL
jgi:polysaccharide export outer membrane protein